MPDVPIQPMTGSAGSRGWGAGLIESVSTGVGITATIGLKRGYLLGEVRRGDNHTLSRSEDHAYLFGILFENGVIKVKDKVTGATGEPFFQERPGIGEEIALQDDDVLLGAHDAFARGA